MKRPPPTQMEEQECGAAPHSCLIEMANEVSTAAGQAVARPRPAHCPAAFEPEN
jgi:hypothetical protein